MKLRSVSKWLASTIGGTLLTPFLQAPATKLAETLHFDTALSDHWRPLMQWLSDLSHDPWYIAVACLAVGFALGMWADAVLRLRERPAPVPEASREDLVEFGRECVAISDETFRTQQQIEDAAPRQVHPPGGYKSNDEWARAHADFGREMQAYGRRTMMQRDRSHGADLMDAIFRLRDLGLTIPVFADSPPEITGEVRAMMLPHYLPAYARFVGTMGRILKRGDLEAARQSSREWRQVTERGMQAE